MPTGRIAIESPSDVSMTTGFLRTPSVERIATCGWLMIGAVISVPNVPEFDSVYVPPAKSSGFSRLLRARCAMSAMASASCATESLLGRLDHRRHETLGAEVDRDREIHVLVQEQGRRPARWSSGAGSRAARGTRRGR